MTSKLRVFGPLGAALAAVLSATGVHADTCPIAGQRPMLIVQMFFGEDIDGKRHISEREWHAFLRDEVTPRFPDGFTMFDAYGQWRASAGSKIVRERSKVVEIAAPEFSDAEAKVGDIAAHYRAKFHQQSVGIVTMPGCGAF